MAAAQHKLSRRALLAAACAGAAVAAESRWIPDQVRHDEGGGFGHRWRKAADRYRRAEAGLVAVAHTEDDDVYDHALGRHSAVLARLLRTPAPDLAAVALKLDLILRHSVFELTFAEPCFAALQRDVRGFAALASGLGTLGGTVTSDFPK